MELRSFMGLVNQMSKHPNEISGAAIPLRTLLKIKDSFLWMQGHTRAMKGVQGFLLKARIRSHFDPKLPTILECDAAKTKGIGYILMQRHGYEKDEHGKDIKDKPIMKLIEADSRWLPPAEQNYGTTSFELAGIYWATEKCELYLLGLHHCEIIMVHQALVSILNTKTLDGIENLAN